jgi:hypothetical protein
MRSLSADEVRWLRVRAQGLAGDGSRTVRDAVRAAAALQAQASGPARLQVWSRTQGLRVADVDAAVAEAAVVRTWLMRGTIHMVAADDLRAFLAVLGPVNLRGDDRRREQLGLTDQLCARAMDALGKILGGGRALTRAEIVAELAEHGVAIDLKSQQPPHLLAYAANSALICRGPDAVRDEPTYVLLDDWLKSAAPTTTAPDREAALAHIATRYFAAYAPAKTADLAAWSGLSAADAKTAVELVRDTLEEVGHDGLRLLLPRDGSDSGPAAEPTPPERPHRLLARFDPYLLGHRSRELILDPAFAKRVNAGGGMIAQTMLDDGRVVGTWTARGLEPFAEPPSAAAEDWQRELGAAAAF